MNKLQMINVFYKEHSSFYCARRIIVNLYKREKIIKIELHISLCALKEWTDEFQHKKTTNQSFEIQLLELSISLNFTSVSLSLQIYAKRSSHLSEFKYNTYLQLRKCIFCIYVLSPQLNCKPLGGNREGASGLNSGVHLARFDNFGAMELCILRKAIYLASSVKWV